MRDERYDRWWQDHESAGPGNWRDSHHGQPNPELGALCELAEQTGLYVELLASHTRYGPPDAPYRKLTAIQVDQPLADRAAIIEKLRPGVTLGAAAARAREKLQEAT